MKFPPLAIGAFLAPSPLYACAVCFGKFDNPNISWAYLLGGIILIGFTFLLLGGLVAAIYHIETHRSVGERE